MADDRPLIVVADGIDQGAVAALSEGPCRVVDATAGFDSLRPHLGSAWGLIVRSRTKVTREILGLAPNLKIIARAGVGVDNIDMKAATDRGVLVVNAPAAATTSVAELSIALYILLVRDLLGPIGATRSGGWPRGTHGHELAGTTVGFIGYGRIAREIARRLLPFGARPIAHDPFLTSSPDGTPLVPLDELLSTSNIVSLHAALSEENRHLIDAPHIARMRRGTYVVNVARGALVDETALLAALDSGQLAGAALDVYEVEPPVRAELVRHPRIIPTPHLGASTHEAQQRAGSDVVQELLRALKREPLKYPVNPEVIGRP